MSTRSFIGIHRPDGSIDGIYCHFDGYLIDGVGEMLLNHYQNPDKIESLIQLGSISYLEKEVAPEDGTVHSFEHPQDGVTVAYHRDRHEPHLDIVHAKNLQQLQIIVDRSWYEYVYLFDQESGIWQVNTSLEMDKKQMQNLEDVIKAQQIEEHSFWQKLN